MAQNFSELQSLVPQQRVKSYSRKAHLSPIIGAFIAFCLLIVRFSSILDGIHSPFTKTPSPPKAPVHVAVVGAGPAGVATAWTLSLEARKASRNVQITVFETKGRIGGRMQADFQDFTLSHELLMEDVATGTLWKDNLFAMRVQDVFGVRACDAGKKSDEVGFWDGSGFVETLPRPLGQLSYVEWLKRTFRYGLMWVRNVNRLKSASRFDSFFAKKPTVENLRQLLEDSGMTASVASSARDLVVQAGVSQAYVKKVLIPQIRRQTGGQYYAELSTAAINRAVWMEDHPACPSSRKFEDVLNMFLAEGNLDVALHTSVVGLEELKIDEENDIWLIKSKYAGDDIVQEKVFDHVVLAAPWNTTIYGQDIEQVRYRSVWVTYLISPTKLEESYFGSKGTLPAQILPTQTSHLPDLFEGIFELSLLRNIYGFDITTQSSKYLYRVLSDYQISNQTFIIATGLHGSVKVQDYKIDNAYPDLHPRDKEYGSFSLQRGLWHTSVVEAFGSEISLSWGAGENVGRLIWALIK